MATYPYSVARMATPQAPQLDRKDNHRVNAVKRRLQKNNRLPNKGR